MPAVSRACAWVPQRWLWSLGAPRCHDRSVWRHCRGGKSSHPGSVNMPAPLVRIRLSVDGVALDDLGLVLVRDGVQNGLGVLPQHHDLGRCLVEGAEQLATLG